jgi:uncharacterized protein (TIGR01370 family)
MQMARIVSLSRRAAWLSLLASALPAQRERAIDRGARGREVRPRRWIVYYGNREPAETFAPYPFVVFDSRYHPPVEPLLGGTRKVAGYLSVGEASSDYPYFAELQRQGLLARPSATWEGNYSIDLRDSRWRRRVCDELIPSILKQGFDGVFLDTVDSALALEETNPARFQGMTIAAADLIAEIRRLYPAILLMLNRGYKLLPMVESHVDVAVAESVYGTFDFRRKRYVKVEEAAYTQQLDWLQSARRRRPELLVFTLDYCDPQNVDGIRQAYQVERRNGFCPYVTSIDLTTVVHEPG